MALSDAFLAPRGLVALAALLPLVLLYLVRSDPETVRLPTVRFLAEERRQDATTPFVERLQRSALLLLQAAVVVLVALSLAGPYVVVSEERVVRETVLVVDASASMATETGDGARFDAAVSAARGDVTGTTSVVTAAGEGRVHLRDGGRNAATAALDRLTVSHAAGGLRDAIARASAVAGEESRIVVYSDFAGADDGWTDEVTAARARGLSVDLKRFGGGGADNVGVVDRSFSGGNVTASVKNFGGESVRRTLTLGDQRRSLTLAPGDVAEATFEVPPGGGELRLSPGDSFPTDDAAYVAAPEESTVEVLVLTNDENEYLTTALSVVDEVSLTVRSPPTSVDREYDAVVYSNVDSERLGDVEAGRETLARGGGVAVQSQLDAPEVYGDLSLLSPNGTATNPTIGPVANDPVTRGITFPPPEGYVTGSLRGGDALVETTDGTPLIATAERGDGRLLYYGYVEESSSFKYNYRYPVFWKRAVFFLAGRDPLPSLNRETGETLEPPNGTTVRTPAGTTAATRVPLDRVGFYEAGDRRIGVSLYSESESDVRSAPLDEREAMGGVSTRVEERRAPKPLTGGLAVLAAGAVIGELLYLRRRGEI